LLGWSIVALLFTYSRGGLAVFVCLLILSILIFVRKNWKKSQKQKVWLKAVWLSGLALVILSLVIVAAAQKNNYFSRLWTYWSEEESEGTYLYYIAFSQRLAYWETAYRIFEDYPWVGIGLGNFTFYFEEYLPDRQYRNPELFLKLVPEEGRNQIVTVKNFFLRLLAETGILGVATFITFLVALGGCVVFLIYSKKKIEHFWGLAGFIGLFIFLPVTLSVDSFALPNMWVVFGLITAGSRVFSR
jgi:O-antigen ligase